MSILVALNSLHFLYKIYNFLFRTSQEHVMMILHDFRIHYHDHTINMFCILYYLINYMVYYNMTYKIDSV